MDKADDAFRTISEVADDLDIPQHVLRFWETRFGQIKPMKRSGGRRYYRPDDILLLRGIRRLLYAEGYTIRGVQRILKEQGLKAVQAFADSGNLPLSNSPATPADPGLDVDEAVAEDFAAESVAAAAANASSLPPAAMTGPTPKTDALQPERRDVQPAAVQSRGLTPADKRALTSVLDELIAARATLDAAMQAAD